MRKKFEIIFLLAFVIIISGGIAAAEQASMEQLNVQQKIKILTQAAQKAEEAGYMEEAQQIRRQINLLNEQVQVKSRDNQNTKQLNQIDKEIARLKQLTKEAEEIRANIARQANQPEVITPQPRPQRPPQGQLPATTGAVPARPRASTPSNPQTTMTAIKDNIPELVGQLKTAFSSYLEHVQAAYKNTQNRLTNILSENQNLLNENKQLRDENLRLKNRIQQLESQ